MRISTISHDEENLFEDVVTPTRTTSAPNVIRFISEKLLDWGVEERGVSHMVLTFATCLTLIRERFICLSLDRYTPRRYRRENRNAFYQDIFRMAVCEYEHPVVRLPF